MVTLSQGQIWHTHAELEELTSRACPIEANGPYLCSEDITVCELRISASDPEQVNK